MDYDFKSLEERVHYHEDAREGDIRTPFERDRSRIIHSAAFRRLQGKTQVMGVGEGDFHRTRLTHSIEAAQIGQGLTAKLKKKYDDFGEIMETLPERCLIEAACFAHDLGHPPYGHGGERALHSQMIRSGGFEGNGQTLRILVRLEKYNTPHQGINPTRRLILALLKYAVPYSSYPESVTSEKPPKCYFDSEKNIIERCLESVPTSDRKLFLSAGTKKHKPDPQHMTLDASIMEMADDIAYAVHDLEDIVARKLVDREEVHSVIESALLQAGNAIAGIDGSLDAEIIISDLFSKWSGNRKQAISRLVNLFINSARIEENEAFIHPLMRLRATQPEPLAKLLQKLKDATYELVVEDAGVQQLETRGQRIVSALFQEFLKSSDKLIPKSSWNDLNSQDSNERRISDYIAGMTDTYAQKVYQRLFTPGFGSSYDEL